MIFWHYLIKEKEEKEGKKTNSNVLWVEVNNTRQVFHCFTYSPSLNENESSFIIKKVVGRVQVDRF